MKQLRIYLGIGVLLLACVSAWATAKNDWTNWGWYQNDNGNPVFTVISYFCKPGEPTCKGTSGPSEGRQLFDDVNFLIPLESE